MSAAVFTSLILRFLGGCNASFAMALKWAGSLVIHNLQFLAVRRLGFSIVVAFLKGCRFVRFHVDSR